MELLKKDNVKIIDQVNKKSKNNDKQGKQDKSKDTNISKSMALLLRHQAKEFNLVMDKYGFVKINDLIKCGPLAKYKIDMEKIESIVKNDQKGRYEIKDDLIRAVQGHTIPLNPEDTLEPITIDDVFNYPVVVHGTYYDGWKFIKDTGLNKMQRTCVHFAIGYIDDKEVISGMRTSCEVYVEINMVQIFFNDIKLFRS